MQYYLKSFPEGGESGYTVELKALIEYLEGRGVKSIACASLVDKPEARVVEVQAEYVGLESPKLFVVGFGLDYEEKYRNLPYIGVLKEEIYTK